MGDIEGEKSVAREHPYFRLCKRPGRSNWYITWSCGTRSHRVSTKTRDWAEAGLTLERIASLAGPVPPESIAFLERGDRFIIKRMMQTAKNNSHARGQPFEISYGDVLDLWRECAGRCSVSGLYFAVNDGDRRKNPWAPSLDRLDNSKGYVWDNVRIVCVMANIAMGDWGDAALAKLAAGVVARKTQNMLLNSAQASNGVTK